MQNLVTVFGGSGFIGAQAVRQLAKAGWRIRVAVRQPNLAYAMRLHGDVGQIDVVQANIRNEASVRRAIAGYRPMSVRKSWALCSAPLPTTRGKSAKRARTSFSNTTPSTAIKAMRRSFCQSANGFRSLISMRKRSG